MHVAVPVTRLIHDLELDVVKYFGNSDVTYFVSFGGALLNLNTHYSISEYEIDGNNTHISIIGVGNMVVGGAKLGFGAEYKRLSTTMTLFFCDHTVCQNKNPFIFTELKVSYSFLD